MGFVGFYGNCDVSRLSSEQQTGCVLSLARTVLLCFHEPPNHSTARGEPKPNRSHGSAGSLSPYSVSLVEFFT